jgi:hypothetical protein
VPAKYRLPCEAAARNTEHSRIVVCGNDVTSSALRRSLHEMVHLRAFAAGIVVAVLGTAGCGGGNDEGTTSASPGEAVAVEGSANLPGRLNDVYLRLRERGLDVKATSPHPQTPRSLWPTGGLRVETESGPLTIYAYRSQGVVKHLVNPRRSYGLAFPGYRTQWSSGAAGDQLGGCGRYVYFGRDTLGRNTAISRALRIADLCRRTQTEFIIQA